uniref:Uncharacterized protein n=1 Tax=Anguilla anguilla TaxID=7936 RepID=A0A0E9ULB5_ANGAN
MSVVELDTGFIQYFMVI